MFTGIVEELGRVMSLEKNNDSGVIKIETKIVNKDLNIGDSISVNGVCITIVEFSDSYIKGEMMKETLDKTNLNFLKNGDEVNLERALTIDKRLGGHLVSGHVDCMGRIAEKKEEGFAERIRVEYPEELAKFIAKKGSITIDGISLTITEVGDDFFEVSIIPHTMKSTTLQKKKIASIVNLEVDLLARYLDRLMGFRKTEEETKASKIDAQFLMENGFM